MKHAGYALLALFVTIGVGVPLSAHHSFAAAYDMTNKIEIQGVIVQVRLTNPHSWFFLDVKEADGKLTRWAFEAGERAAARNHGDDQRRSRKGSDPEHGHAAATHHQCRQDVRHVRAPGGAWRPLTGPESIG
jgi:hypothetical protein